MATIKIADDIHPVRSNTSTIGGGVYSRRNVSGASVDRRSASKVSLDRRSEKTADVEEPEDEGPGLAQAGDFKKKQVCWFVRPLLNSASHARRFSKERFCCGMYFNYQLIPSLLF
jgi:hypothetical protein